MLFLYLAHGLVHRAALRYNGGSAFGLFVSKLRASLPQNRQDTMLVLRHVLFW